MPLDPSMIFDWRDQSSLDLGDLTAVQVLGRGAKSIAFLVRSKANSEQLFALKVISRASVERNKKSDGYQRILMERELLNSFNNFLFPKLRGSIVTDQMIGLAIDYCCGGDLNTVRNLQTEKTFSHPIIRFYAAELVLALEYLHSQGIVYRDLKPENVLIQQSGHLMLIDFDLSTKIPINSRQTSQNMQQTIHLISYKKKSESSFSPESSVSSFSSSSSSIETSTTGDCEYTRSKSFVGTEDYVAPEIILGKGHDFAVDYWSLGVTIYEMLYGVTPFRGRNRSETFYQILTLSPDLTGKSTPLRDLLGKLLEKDPGKRISGKDVKNHEFFRGIHWDSVINICRPPYIPETRNTYEIHSIDMEKLVQEVLCEEEDVRRGDCAVGN